MYVDMTTNLDVCMGGGLDGKVKEAILSDDVELNVAIARSKSPTDAASHLHPLLRLQFLTVPKVSLRLLELGVPSASCLLPAIFEYRTHWLQLHTDWPSHSCAHSTGAANNHGQYRAVLPLFVPSRPALSLHV